MPFQPVPFTLEVRLTYSKTGNDNQYQNILYYRRNAGWDLASAQTAVQALGTAWIPQLSGHTPTDASLQSITGRDLSTEFGLQVAATGLPLTGSAGAAMSSPNNAALIRFIATAPPPRKGGVFWPFVPEANVDSNGELLAAYRSSIEIAHRDFCGAPETPASCEHVIVSRRQNNALRLQGVVASVQEYECMRRVASQRDRRATLPGF